MPDGLRRGAQARALERAQGDRQPLALGADQVGRGHAHVLEDRRAGRRALDAELVLELADREALAVGLDDEGAQAPVLAVGDREDDVEVRDARVRDPVLGAVDDPLVAVADGGRAHATAASEPASGSLSAKAGDHSPVAHFGSRRSLSSSEPKSAIGSVPSSWIIRMSALDAHALAISSTAIWSMSVPVPVPPYCGVEGQREDVLLGEQLAHVPRVLARGVDLGRARARPSRRRSAGSCRGSPCAPAEGRRCRSGGRAHRTIVEPPTWV